MKKKEEGFWKNEEKWRRRNKKERNDEAESKTERKNDRIKASVTDVKKFISIFKCIKRNGKKKG